MSNSNIVGVTMADYAQVGPVAFGGGNFDFSTPEDLAYLSKAMEAGSITGRETANLTTASAAPLKFESLEKNLKTVTFKETDIVFWKRLPKTPAFNTVEEYNQLSSYGNLRGGFNNEGELPENEDSVYIRRSQLVKFLGVTREVTHPAMLVSVQAGPLIQRETKNGMMWILRAANKALTFGDSALVPQEFNGFYAQHKSQFATIQDYLSSSVVIDLRGESMTEGYLEDGANIIAENYGDPDLIMGPPRILSDFTKNFYGNKFIPLGMPNTISGTVEVGQDVSAFRTPFGRLEIGYDKFMYTDPPRTTTSSPTHPTKAPNTPITGSLAIIASAPNTKFGDSAGDYFYAVSAKNRYGESALLSLNGTLQAVATTDAVNLIFSSGGGSYPATCFVIYRSKKNPGTSLANTKFYPLFTVSVDEKAAGYDGAAAGIVRDNNNFLPDTNQCLMTESSDEVLGFKQLAPLQKMDLAVLSPSQRFMILLYGTPQLFAPLKFVRFINVGRTVGNP